MNKNYFKKQKTAQKHKPNIKNFLISIFVCLIFCLSFTSNLSLSACASKYTTYTYAQIKQENTYLYKSISSTESTNAYFVLPTTYFVLLLSNISENFYKVEYNGVFGYVLKDKVTPINETPQNPYLTNITFRVYSSDGTNVFSSPFNTSSVDNQIIETVEVLSPLTYYGEILGDEFIVNRGYSWVYCKTSSNKFGYVYKGLCDSFSPIYENSEKVTTKTNVFFEEDDNSYLYNLVDVTPGLKVLLIVAVCLPSLFLIYLLFKPFKLEKSLANKKQNIKIKESYKNLNSKNLNYNKTVKNKNLNSNSQQNKKNWFEKLKTLKIFAKQENQNKNYKNKTNNSNQNFKSRKKKNLYNSNQKNKNKTLNTIQKIIDDDLV